MLSSIPRLLRAGARRGGPRTIRTPAAGSSAGPTRRGSASSSGGEALRGPLVALGRLDLAVLRRRVRDERVEQPRRGERDLVHGAMERLRVRQRGRRRAAHLADVLQRGAPYLVLRRGRLEVVQGADVSTHAPSVAAPRALDI